MAEETVRLDMTAMLERFKSLGALTAPAAYVAMLVTGQRMVRDVVKQRLSGPRGATGILGVVTGNARRSMVGPATMTKDMVTAALGSPVEYVKAHEEGFRGTQRVRAHQREQKRIGRKAVAYNIHSGFVSKYSKGRRFTDAEKLLTGRGFAWVTAHDRKVNIIAKHFIRDTVLAAKVPTEDRVLKALQIAFKTGRIPSPGQLNLG